MGQRTMGNGYKPSDLLKNKLGKIKAVTMEYTTFFLLYIMQMGETMSHKPMLE